MAIPDPPKKKKKEFNKASRDDIFDLSSLRNLYKNNDSLLFLGKSSRISKDTYQTQKTISKKNGSDIHSHARSHLRNPLEELAEGSKPTQFKRQREASIRMRREKLKEKGMTQNPQSMKELIPVQK